MLIKVYIHRQKNNGIIETFKHTLQNIALSPKMKIATT